MEENAQKQTPIQSPETGARKKTSQREITTNLEGDQSILLDKDDQQTQKELTSRVVTRAQKIALEGRQTVSTPTHQSSSEGVDQFNTPGQESNYQMEIGLTDTPVGTGDYHRLVHNQHSKELLPKEPSLTHIESCIHNLKIRIDGFVNSCSERVGWMEDFEDHAKGLKDELMQIINRCMAMQYLDALERAYTLSSSLQEHVDMLKEKARIGVSRDKTPIGIRTMPVTDTPILTQDQA